MRGADLITDRYYVRNAEASLFGAGPSWWYPERAADFVMREHLPGNIFNDFNLGAFLTWRLGPDYPVYSDNRAMPFGPGLLFHQQWLLHQSLDSAAWEQEADQRGINTLFLSTSRYGGMQFPLADYCRSRNWVPVYLDDVAAVFVRNRPENEPLIRRLRIDCATAPITRPVTSHGWRRRSEAFEFYSNVAAIFYVLHRDGDAFEALARAEQLFPDDASIHLTKAQLFEANGRNADAEREYRVALRLRETSIGWYLLGRLLGSEKRWTEAEDAVQRAAQSDVYPHAMYLELGELYLATRQPALALKAFEEAHAHSPFCGDVAQFGSEFNAQLERGEARATHMLRGEKRIPQ
jgi:tetratricopeptide (TPR) repeat protein